MSAWTVRVEVTLPDDIEEGPVAVLASLVSHALADAEVPVLSLTVEQSERSL